MTFLKKILSDKKKEVDTLKKVLIIKDLEKSIFFSRKTLPLSEFILNPARSGIVAEFKRKSPSAGILNSHAMVEKVTKGYARAGASGLSILTDKLYFGGDCTDLKLAREHNDIPILRKEFIIDEFQVIESKASGADAILLIAALLENVQISKLASLSRSLDMEVILEIHSLQELDKVNEHINIIGVNNRDLKSLTTNPLLSIELADKIPAEFIKISESGLSKPRVVIDLRNAGYDGFLIGEHFMSSPDPVTAFTDFVKMIKESYKNLKS
jgi:indole-3-glycerol phosphate synthase